MCKQACVTLLSYFSQNSEVSSRSLLFTYLPLFSLLCQLPLFRVCASVVPCLFRIGLTRSISAVFPYLCSFGGGNRVKQCIALILCVILCNLCRVIPLDTPHKFFSSGGSVLKLGIFPCKFYRVALTFWKLFTTLFFLIFLTLYRLGAYLLT